MKNKEEKLSPVQIAMMALGGIIGGSFFIGSSVAIKAVGPSIIISYMLGGILVYFILASLSEMTREDSDPGSFRTFAVRAFGPGTGFVVGWVYWTGMVLAMSSEATAVSILFRSWFPNLSTALIGGSVIIIVTLVNLMGAGKISRIECILVIFKLLAIVIFIIIAVFLIFGLISGIPAVGIGKLKNEQFFHGGIRGIGGSMLTVIFAYAGFETIGLSVSEARNPEKTIPLASRYTVFSLIALYVISVALILPLISTQSLDENVSPMVAALDSWGMTWAGDAINLVMVTAILSTMLAAMFGMGRMLRSIAGEGYTPRFLKDKKDIPYRGMIFSGISMLVSLMLGLLFPRVYLFLVSSGGFAFLFTYSVIMASKIKLYRKSGGSFMYTEWFTLVSLIAIIFSMPFIPGQSSGLVAGIVIISMYSAAYIVYKYYRKTERLYHGFKRNRVKFDTELSKELNEKHKEDLNDK